MKARERETFNNSYCPPSGQETVYSRVKYQSILDEMNEDGRRMLLPDPWEGIEPREREKLKQLRKK
jgi:hypothetical protein